MDFGFTVNRNENDITAGIGTSIIKFITKAIESNSMESFYKIDGFCNRVLMMSIENKHEHHFKEYLDIVVGYYIISYNYNNKNEALYNKIYQACADRSARRIRELFILLNHFFNKSDFEDKRTYNHFKLLAFTTFSQLLFEQVKRKDIIWFKHTLNQIENVFLGETIGMSEFVMTLRNPANIDKTKLGCYIEDIQVNIYVKNSIFGIRYWLYYLYKNVKISLEELTQFINPTGHFKRNSLSVDFWEMELLFNKLNSANSFGYFNWQNWEYETHPEGEAHTMPSVFDWIFTGYIIDALRRGGIQYTPNFDVNLIESNFNPQNKSLFINTLNEKLEKVISEKDKWIHLFKNDEFDSRVNVIREQLNSFSSIIEIQKAKEIAFEKLDITKVDVFKQSLYDRWNKSKLIRKIFEHFDDKRKYEGEIGKLKRVGQNMFFEKAKMLFLNKYFQHIYGVEDLGAQLSKWEDEFFFQIILTAQTEIVYSSINAGLQKAINKIKYSNNSPSIIFVDSALYWLGLKNDEKWNDEKIFDFSNGSYDSIPVCFINEGLMQNRFIVADFKKAFTMLYREIEGGFDGELKVEIKEVTNEIAQKKLNNEPQKWKYIDGYQISDEDAIAYIKTSVIIDFEVIELYEVNDNNAFEIGLIEGKLES